MSGLHNHCCSVKGITFYKIYRIPTLVRVESFEFLSGDVDRLFIQQLQLHQSDGS